MRVKKKMIEHNATVYLVNTGWIGNSASSGDKRVCIKTARKIIHSIIDFKTINQVKIEEDVHTWVVLFV